MNVEQSATIMCHELGSENAHEAGKQYQIRLECIDFGDQCLIKCRAVGKVAVIESAGLNAGSAGAGQAIGFGFVGDNGDDFGRRVCAGEIVDQCLQVGA